MPRIKERAISPRKSQARYLAARTHTDRIAYLEDAIVKMKSPEMRARISDMLGDRPDYDEVASNMVSEYEAKLRNLK